MPRQTRKLRGGSPFPLSFFNPSYREPSASSGSDILGAQAGLARPVINPTGGSRRRKPRKYTKKRGGFYPSVMGSFLTNAARLVPATIYSGYRFVKKYKAPRGTRKSRRS